jgi:hypothetical protein
MHPFAIRRAAIPRSLAHTARAVLVAGLSAFAHAQETLAQIVAHDAHRLLAHADPEVRGEAALVATVHPGPSLQGDLLALAVDKEAPARHRALIALGLYGSPTAVQFLGELLDDTGTRGGEDGIAAAFGLGLAPTSATTAVTTRILSQIAQSSWKRQRDTLLAFLLAMSRQPERSETAALRRLFDDESNRDPDVRALLLRLLLGNDRSLDDKTLVKLLGRGSDPERRELLAWLGRDAKELANDWLNELHRIATQAEDGELRALALAALTRARYQPAYGIATRALRGGSPAECGQALRTLAVFGGVATLRAAATRIRDERDPAIQAALLAHFDAPLSPELTEDCTRIAQDKTQPWPLRATAANALARSSGSHAAPVVRELFRTTADAASLPALAASLRTTHDEPPPLAALIAGDDPRRDPRRWHALLLTEHPEAQRLVLAALRDAGKESPLAALRAWRAAMVLGAPTARAGAMPEFLRVLLAP